MKKGPNLNSSPEGFWNTWPPLHSTGFFFGFFFFQKLSEIRFWRLSKQINLPTENFEAFSAYVCA